MAFRPLWIPTGPPLPLADLYDENVNTCFQYHGHIYIERIGYIERIDVNADQPSEELHYLATAFETGVSAHFLGSTRVTPMVIADMCGFS